MISAEALVTWCRDHNSRVLVKKKYDETVCDDPVNHTKHYNFLDSQRRARRAWEEEQASQQTGNKASGGRQCAYHPEVWAMLDRDLPEWYAQGVEPVGGKG